MPSPRSQAPLPLSWEFSFADWGRLNGPLGENLRLRHMGKFTQMFCAKFGNISWQAHAHTHNIRSSANLHKESEL